MELTLSQSPRLLCFDWWNGSVGNPTILVSFGIKHPDPSMPAAKEEGSFPNTIQNVKYDENISLPSYHRNLLRMITQDKTILSRCLIISFQL